MHKDHANLRSNKLLARLEIDDLNIILGEKRLRWFVHVERSNGAMMWMMLLHLHINLNAAADDDNDHTN